MSWEAGVKGHEWGISYKPQRWWLGGCSASAWRFLVALESGETYSLPTAPVIMQLEEGHFFDASITKQHLFASVHDAVLFALQHRRSGPVDPVLVS